MGRDLSQLLLLVGIQVRFDVLRVAPDQINARGNHNVQVDDPGATTLPFALRCPSQFPGTARSRYHVAGVRMIDQINSQRLNAIRPDQLRSLGFELRQLKDRDLARIATILRLYRNAVQSIL